MPLQSAFDMIILCRCIRYDHTVPLQSGIRYDHTVPLQSAVENCDWRFPVYVRHDNRSVHPDRRVLQRRVPAVQKMSVCHSVGIEFCFVLFLFLFLVWPRCQMGAAPTHWLRVSLLACLLNRSVAAGANGFVPDGRQCSRQADELVGAARVVDGRGKIFAKQQPKDVRHPLDRVSAAWGTTSCPGRYG